MAKKASASGPKRKYVRTAKLDNESIGKLGGYISSTLLLKEGYFDVEVLGGVCPAFDLLCTIKDKAKPYMFLVQVKAMEEGKFTKKRPICIKTPVPKEKLKWLADRPLPSYVMGVDTSKNEAYIAPAFDRTVTYANILTKYKMEMPNMATLSPILKQIKDEVIRYWDKAGISAYKQKFKSTLV